MKLQCMENQVEFTGTETRMVVQAAFMGEGSEDKLIKDKTFQL